MEERIHFSPEEISISRLTESDVSLLSDFYCGVAEIDSFFQTEAIICGRYHYLIPYKCILKETGEIIGAFTLANDVLMLEFEDKTEIADTLPEYFDVFKHQASYPAVNIGHLAVKNGFQSQGLGRLIIEFVEITLMYHSISGCQFITVDALNRDRTLKFYEYKCGFQFQTVTDVAKPTRRMYLPIFVHSMD